MESTITYGQPVQTISLEVQLTTTGGKYFLPDDATLRNKEIVALFIPDNTNDTAYSPLARPLASNDAIRSSWIVLKEVSDDILSMHPCSDLLQNPTDRSIRSVRFCGLNPQSSYIQVTNPALITAGESIVITILYIP